MTSGRMLVKEPSDSSSSQTIVSPSVGREFVWKFSSLAPIANAGLTPAHSSSHVIMAETEPFPFVPVTPIDLRPRITASRIIDR